MNDVRWFCTDGTNGELNSKDESRLTILENKLISGHMLILRATGQYLKEQYKGFTDTNDTPVTTVVDSFFTICTAQGWLGQIEREHTAKDAIRVAIDQLVEGNESYYL